MASVNLAERLMTRTRTTESGCMEYIGCVQSNGYSRATVQGKTDYGHRHIYRLVCGDIPGGFDVRHSCDNRRCINPEHLTVGTRAENMQDAVSRGRQAKGLALPQTKLGENQRAALVEMAISGVPYSAIAKTFGICKQHAGHIAIKHGVRRNGKSE